MPILDSEDARFRGARSSDFASSLPGDDILAKAGVSDFWARLLRDGWQEKHTKNYAEISTNLLVRLTTKYGVPSYRIGALERVFDISHDLRENLAEIPWDRVADSGKALGQLRALDGAFQSVATAIPIVRWVVRIGISIYQTVVAVRDLITEREEKGDPLPATALVYKVTSDSRLTNDLLAYAHASDDWTLLFSPTFTKLDRTHTGKPHWDQKAIAWNAANIQEGFSLTFNHRQNLGFGIIPGFPRIPSDVIQARGTGEDRHFQWDVATDVGENTQLVPSACQCGVTLWQMVMKNGPHAWRINPDKIIEAWYEYFDILNLYVDISEATAASGRGGGSGAIHVRLPWAVSAISNWAVARGKLEHGGKLVSRVSGLDVGDVPDQYVQPGIKGRCSWAQLVEWQVRGVWERRLRPMLGTLTCAYVDESFAGIRWAKASKPELYRRWLEMRRLLLTHSARRLVDLDLVPDREYRQALESARRQASLDLAPRPDDSPAPGIEPLDRLQGSLPQGPYGGGARLEPGETAWDDEPAIVPPEANLPDPEDLPLPPLREEEKFPWGRVAVAGIGAALLFGVR